MSQSKGMLVKMLKEKYPNTNQFDCSKCSYSKSNESNQLVCTLHNKVVSTDYLCADFK